MHFDNWAPCNIVESLSAKSLIAFALHIIIIAIIITITTVIIIVDSFPWLKPSQEDADAIYDAAAGVDADTDADADDHDAISNCICTAGSLPMVKVPSRGEVRKGWSQT